MQATTAINTPNKTNNFYPCDDQWIMTVKPIVASVAMESGTALGVEVSGSSPTGNLKKMGTTNTGGFNFKAILIDTISTTDADYATAGKLKQVRVPRTNTAVAYFTVWAGTFTLADVGRTAQFHSDSKSVAVDTNGLGVLITGYISSTRGLCTFAAPISVTA